MSRFSAWLNGLTEDTTPDANADFVVTYDASATTSKKVKVANVAAAGTAPALVKLSETILGGTATNFDFNSISGSYRSLRLIVQARGDNASANIYAHLTFNADTGANYDVQFVNANDTTVNATAVAAGAQNYALYVPGSSAPSGSAGLCEIMIANYAGTTFHKSYSIVRGVSQGTAAANQYHTTGVGRWRNTAAITRVTLTIDTGNFIAGSVATLYGLT